MTNQRERKRSLLRNCTKREWRTAGASELQSWTAACFANCSAQLLFAQIGRVPIFSQFAEIRRANTVQFQVSWFALLKCRTRMHFGWFWRRGTKFATYRLEHVLENDRRRQGTTVQFVARNGQVGKPLEIRRFPKRFGDFLVPTLRIAATAKNLWQKWLQSK